jgi:hypothetical protein
VSIGGTRSLVRTLT